MPDAARPGEPHLGPVDFEYPLPHLAESLKHGRKNRIVAIGSSSTAGADGVLPFPPCLEMTLRRKLYGEWATRFIALALSRAIVGASQAMAWARWPSRPDR